MKGGDADQLKRRADDDRDFGILRDYFGTGSGRNWRERDKVAGRILRNDKRKLDAFWITYKNPGEGEWAHVMLTRDDNGREESAAYLWRGNKAEFSDRFYVQNGNIRREDVGRVDGRSAVSVEQAEPGANEVVCALDAILCGVLQGELCIVGTGFGIEFCVAAGLGLNCIRSARGLLVACADESSSFQGGCREFVGEECQ